MDSEDPELAKALTVGFLAGVVAVGTCLVLSSVFSQPRPHWEDRERMVVSYDGHLYRLVEVEKKYYIEEKDNGNTKSTTPGERKDGERKPDAQDAQRR